jgi:hypothetical protein
LKHACSYYIEPCGYTLSLASIFPPRFFKQVRAAVEADEALDIYT